VCHPPLAEYNSHSGVFGVVKNSASPPLAEGIRHRRRSTQMSENDYAEEVVGKFIRDITDHVFLAIEHNETLMREYQTNVNRYGLDKVNMAIGKKVKTMLNLDNDGVNKSPKSKLIKDYTCHKLKPSNA
jgi:hypothetical protein